MSTLATQALIALLLSSPHTSSAQCSVTQVNITADSVNFCSAPFTVAFQANAARDTTPVLLSTNLSSSNFQSPFTLNFPTGNNACRYQLEMAGSAGLWLGSNRADAYAKFNGIDNSPYGPPGMSNWFLNIQPISGLSAYNPLHVYQLDYIGDGNTVTFNFTDNPYSDNNGQVIFKWSAVPCYTYHWDFGDGTTSSAVNPTHTFANNGNYNIILTITDDLSNCTASSSIQVRTLSLPIVDLGSDMQLCNGDTVVLSPMAGPVNYLWQDQSTNTTYTVASSGIYSVLASNICGSDSDTVSIQYDAAPSFMLPSDTLICMDESIMISAPLFGTYQWQDGSNDDELYVDTSGLYVLSITNHCGTGRDSIRVDQQYCDCRIFVPSAFSPDGDGFNDYFKAIALCRIAAYQLRVYNRWGELLFETNDISSGWDGSYNGRKADIDSYPWTIGYEYLLPGDVVEFGRTKGMVTIIR